MEQVGNQKAKGLKNYLEKGFVWVTNEIFYPNGNKKSLEEIIEKFSPLSNNFITKRCFK